MGSPGGADQGAVHHCPLCMKRYPLPGYVCLGGWETYPERGGELAAPHEPTAVVPIRQ